MFSINDICNIAIQIEQNGERTYRVAAEKTDDRQLVQMLEWMADEEARHAMWFKSLAPGSERSGNHGEIESMGRSLLREMMKDQSFSLEETGLLDVDGILGLLAQSIEFEQDTILFYEMLSSFIEEGPTIDQLNRVIKEEHGHVEQLERLQRIYKGKQNER
jgi:rubrerythrin